MPRARLASSQTEEITVEVGRAGKRSRRGAVDIDSAGGLASQTTHAFKKVKKSAAKSESSPPPARVSRKRSRATLVEEAVVPVVEATERVKRPRKAKQGVKSAVKEDTEKVVVLTDEEQKRHGTALAHLRKVCTVLS
tara:strand:+ start:928 stop:1338 length:411 start_codon:yes stop_codon:yes gene_type:complete